MAAMQGKVILVVNVASQCGFTPQYKELAELDGRYRSKGLVILGFPCNQVRQMLGHYAALQHALPHLPSSRSLQNA